MISKHSIRRCATLLLLVAGFFVPAVQSATSTGNPRAMNESVSPIPGFVYSSQMADMFGLDPDTSTEIDPPLLGAVLEISKGITGANLCRLHLYIDSTADLRLPEQESMVSIGPHVQQLPYAVLKKPATDIRKEISLQVRELANLAIIRFGRGSLEMPVLAGEDTAAAYTSFPLDAYDKSLVGGVTWLVMGINCAIAAEGNFDTVTMYFEKQSSPDGMIVNQQIDPFQLTAVNIPMSLFEGMQEDLLAATEEDAQGISRNNTPRFRVISD